MKVPRGFGELSLIYVCEGGGHHGSLKAMTGTMGFTCEAKAFIRSGPIIKNSVICQPCQYVVAEGKTPTPEITRKLTYTATTETGATQTM